MVYSPGIILIRDDDGEWRSPVEVDVLTSAAVNAGEIRRELEREERLRIERVEMENWKRRGEERRKEIERAMAERQRQREEKQRQREEKAEKQRQKEENKKAKEESAKLKKEQANLVELKKEMVIEKETDKGKTKDSGSEKEETFDDQGKAVAEVENENEESEEWEEVGVEKPEENQENTIESQDNGLECGSDSQPKSAEENTESKGTPIQDDQLQPEAPPEVKQEPTSSNTIVHLLSPPTQPSQAPVPDPKLTYALARENAEVQIEQTMYARISRILHLFQLHQTPHLILGSFGTGVFKNRTDLIANIFADLLIKPGGRFKDVFQTVLFAILGKETVRVFNDVFSRVDKRAQRERTGKTCVFVDWHGSRSDRDVKEGDEEKRKRMMRWEAKRKGNSPSMYVIPDTAADATSFYPAQVDVACHSLSSVVARSSDVPYPTSSDAASYPPFVDATKVDAAPYGISSNATQASVASCPPSLDSAKASAISCPTIFTAAQADATVPANPTATGIPEDAKVILTRGDDFVAKASANPPITPKAMVVDDGKYIDTVETKSFPTGSREAKNSRSNKEEGGNAESLRLQDIAQETIKAIEDGYVDFPDTNMRLTRHNIRKSANDTVCGTEYFEPDTPWLKCWWKGPLHGAESRGKKSGVAVRILEMSTLQGAHFLSQSRPAFKIGVLNFASATQPDGEFLNNFSAQEGSITRSSTLYLSLQTRQASPFYELHRRDNGGGYYSHAMIYSPSVTIFRNDNGGWLCPYHVDIVTSRAVNAGLLRKLRSPETESIILSVMKERMGRILALFERSGIKNLVLGSFGTGVLQNDIGSLAKIWGELLYAPGARFADSFDQVIFAIPDSYTRRNFGTSFNVAVNPPRWHHDREFSHDTGSIPTNKDLTPKPHSHGAQNSRSNKKDHAIDPKRISLRDIAQGTTKAIKDGYVDIRSTRHNIRQSADDTIRDTEYFEPDSPWLKGWWKGPLYGESHGYQSRVAVQILKMSTLQGAHYLSQFRPAFKIGVLNLASATQPGGEFMNGASSQEGSIARSSTLYQSLTTRQAAPFYELHDRDNGEGFYSHSMIYSPSVAIFRNDNGDWLCPYHVDIVTSPAINIGLVHTLRYDSWPDTARRISSMMRERMGRILALFKRSGIRNLVLGSFETGFLHNDVESLARIWGELLCAPGARFSDSFDRVIFAIPDSYTRREFRTGFNAGVNPPQIWIPPSQR